MDSVKILVPVMDVAVIGADFARLRDHRDVLDELGTPTGIAGYEVFSADALRELLAGFVLVVRPEPEALTGAAYARQPELAETDFRLLSTPAYGWYAAFYTEAALETKQAHGWVVYAGPAPKSPDGQ